MSGNSSSSKAKVYLMQPSYDGTCRQELIGQIIQATAKNVLRSMAMQGFSGPSHNFNQLWCRALNSREESGITHALMLHADIVPIDALWLDKLIDVMGSTGADLLSVVSPIKNPKGLTSIAIDEWDYWRPRRLTMREIMKMPATFTDEKLLINTGMMLVDLRKPWVDEVCFQYEDKIEKVDGKFVARFSPEDWNLSRKARSLGAKIFATREVRINHFGNGVFGNYSNWGELETDVRQE